MLGVQKMFRRFEVYDILYLYINISENNLSSKSTL
jgi:hypothetical protein